MTPTLDCPATTTDKFLPKTEALFSNQESAQVETNVICSLSGGEAFVEDNRKLYVPVMVAFGGGQLHMCRLYGFWDLEGMVLDYGNKLNRSIRLLPSKNAKERTKKWDDLTFKLGPRSFLYADENRMVGFATTAGEAERLVNEFAGKYQKPKPDSNSGTFHLIQFNQDNIRTKEVALSPETRLTPNALSLRYGKGSEAWHNAFIQKLKSKTVGLSILEGKPGTGKTYYLRHLMGELKETHRFYFIPTASIGILSKPEFIGFWADQRSCNSEKQFVVILEDADGALMARGPDNREQVSALLNLADGMLGDFLRLQIICTINCSAADLDQALLRPGRLICHRVFGRLDYNDAVQLAESLGRKLPQASDYSLAEVFTGGVAEEIHRPPMGFGRAH